MYPVTFVTLVERFYNLRQLNTIIAMFSSYFLKMQSFLRSSRYLAGKRVEILLRYYDLLACMRKRIIEILAATLGAGLSGFY